jgi:hypothetical protein
MIIKFWLDVSGALTCCQSVCRLLCALTAKLCFAPHRIAADGEQERRFEGRLHRSWKRWKLSPMDLFARSRWTEYARARDEMLRRTDHPAAPWVVVPSDNKKSARLNCISDLLSRIKYEEIHPVRLAHAACSKLAARTRRSLQQTCSADAHTHGVLTPTRVQAPLALPPRDSADTHPETAYQRPPTVRLLQQQPFRTPHWLHPTLIADDYMH